MCRFIGRRGGFTIVELLVVVAIIGVLLGLLAPALSGVQKRSRKAKELNSLKQVGLAWMLYANTYRDAALPGFLEVDVQAPRSISPGGWGVKFDYPTPVDPTDPATIVIPPAPAYTCEPDDRACNIAGPWPWRLLPYLDYSVEIIHGYRDELDADIFTLVQAAEDVAYEPAFGYNGYYIGGWWEKVDFEVEDVGTVTASRFKFFDHIGSDKKPFEIPLTHAQIERASEVVTFCSSALLTTGTYYRIHPDTPGSHLVVPPVVANEQHWQLGGSQPSGTLEIAPTASTVVEVVTPEAHPPIGRHTNAAAVLYADGHVDSQTPGALIDQRKWISSATTRKYTHEQP